MNLQRFSIFGSDNIGVYIFTNDKYTIIPTNLDKQSKSIIQENLNTELIETTVADSFLTGIFVAGNNETILLPRIVRDVEINAIKSVAKDVNIEVVDVRATALGNVILANDNAALVYPEFSDAEMNIIGKALNVKEIRKGTIAQVLVVGSAGVVTSKGGLLHVEATEEEVKSLSSFFKVNLDVGTVNFGSAFIRSGMVANSHGILVGSSTTGPEILRIQRAFSD
ncbi:MULTISPECIES: translation initiation factor IF-6 [Metallosphaera]|uniref:Translation initiation factor 6 n=3 Tax=Metallosphaera TaxID=41980 RepID=A4YH81_METS5|nr:MULTISPECIES: translation initiation factor IF-6 [Metallosphaera]ABP95783.1 translation initiation factor 6 (aeIF-6) [Metallosphaera sedula DSM 5348]AIM27767.1 translation initiation factor 6 (aeIF-6) [Metallosphaera sedula]AKV74623.1 translation initiation factor IF-6 [Metallosphaera sedula]AKV76861.1 translation initiation factor IF-6 [Metallosphaera sedula]AKV79112.1 translation initiation factor IF-6 [Metallosphaera sedula]